MTNHALAGSARHTYLSICFIRILSISDAIINFHEPHERKYRKTESLWTKTFQ